MASNYMNTFLTFHVYFSSSEPMAFLQCLPVISSPFIQIDAMKALLVRLLFMTANQSAVMTVLDLDPENQSLNAYCLIGSSGNIYSPIFCGLD